MELLKIHELLGPYSKEKEFLSVVKQIQKQLHTYSIMNYLEIIIQLQQCTEQFQNYMGHGGFALFFLIMMSWFALEMAHH